MYESSLVEFSETSNVKSTTTDSLNPQNCDSEINVPITETTSKNTSETTTNNNVFIFDNWRKDFEVYKKYTEHGFRECMEDKEFISELFDVFENVDVVETVRSAYKTYWMLEDGWKQKKKKRNKKIDFKETIRNILRLGYTNVYKGKPKYTQQNMFKNEPVRPEEEILNYDR